jgi:hypothetical protein
VSWKRAFAVEELDTNANEVLYKSDEEFNHLDLQKVSWSTNL